jgi:hypothetical protein
MNESIYNDSFFKSHHQPGSAWVGGYPPIARALVDVMGGHFRVWDMGCGSAALMDALFDLGCEVRGVEGSTAAEPYIPLRMKDRVVFGDLLEECPPEPVDMTICTEVSEHLPASKAFKLVRKIVSIGSPFVYFTAAPPGQGGTHHVNEQEWGYWVDLFWDARYKFHIPMTVRFQKQTEGIALKQYSSNALFLVNVKPGSGVLRKT